MLGSGSVVRYAAWQQALFWLGWLSLLVVGYFIAHGFALVSTLVWYGYQETIDLVVAVIFGTALIELLLIAIYTLVRYWSGETGFTWLIL